MTIEEFAKKFGLTISGYFTSIKYQIPFHAIEFETAPGCVSYRVKLDRDFQLQDVRATEGFGIGILKGLADTDWVFPAEAMNQKWLDIAEKLKFVHEISISNEEVIFIRNSMQISSLEAAPYSLDAVFAETHLVVTLHDDGSIAYVKKFWFPQGKRHEVVRKPAALTKEEMECLL